MENVPFKVRHDFDSDFVKLLELVRPTHRLIADDYTTRSEFCGFQSR